MTTEQHALPSTAPNVQNGTYTIEAPDGRHFTIKLYTQLQGNPAFVGKRVLALLTGPNNERDFTGVAFWNDEKRMAAVWKKHRSATPSTDPEGRVFPNDGYHWDKNWSKVEKKVAVFVDLVVRADGSHWRRQGYKIHHEGRCVRCNRKLTDPESIKSGIGPECAKRGGA